MSYTGGARGKLSKEKREKRERFLAKVKEMALKALEHADIDAGKAYIFLALPLYLN